MVIELDSHWRSKDSHLATLPSPLMVMYQRGVFEEAGDVCFSPLSRQVALSGYLD